MQITLNETKSSLLRRLKEESIIMHIFVMIYLHDIK